jgi:hypothetical protein
MLTKEERLKEFEAITRPVMEWLNNNMHPHATVLVDTTRAELVEGVCAYSCMDYVKD